MYIVSLIGFENNFVYGNYRLRGGFVEGGPFGLFVAYYLILRMNLFGISVGKFLLLLLLIFASQSKASILFILSALFFYLIIAKRIRIQKLFAGVVFCTVLLVFANQYYGFSDRMVAYWQSYQSAEYLVEERSNDGAFVMGRIAAFFIAPEMIRDNIILGVGLGNYSLTRNNPKYLGFFPAVSRWDLPGLGGIANILLELGIVGLLFFLRPFIILFKQSKEKLVKWMVGLVILVQLFGVQTYFQYVWVLVGVMTAIDANPEIIRSIRELKHSKFSKNITI
jgi:hypothetical protein